MNYEHLTPTQRCPVCGHLLNRTAGSANPPAVGDITICAACLEPLEFGAGMLLVRAQPEGFDESIRAQIAYLQWLMPQLKKTNNEKE